MRWTLEESSSLPGGTMPARKNLVDEMWPCGPDPRRKRFSSRRDSDCDRRAVSSRMGEDVEGVSAGVKSLRRERK